MNQTVVLICSQVVKIDTTMLEEDLNNGNIVVSYDVTDGLRRLAADRQL